MSQRNRKHNKAHIWIALEIEPLTLTMTDKHQSNHKGKNPIM